MDLLVGEAGARNYMKNSLMGQLKGFDSIWRGTIF